QSIAGLAAKAVDRLEFAAARSYTDGSIADPVRAQVTTEDGQVVGHGDAQGPGGLIFVNGRDRESTQDLAQRTFVEVGLAGAPGKLIVIAQHEALRPIRISD